MGAVDLIIRSMSFTVSRWRDVYVSTASRGLAGTGTMAVTSTLLLAIQARGLGGFSAGALITVFALPVVFLAPFTGRLVDRVDSRILLIAAGLLESVACFALSGSDALWMMYVGAALVATAGAVIQPTFGALLPSMVTDEDLPRAAALSQTSATVGSLAGPAAAGILVGIYSARTALLVSAGLVLFTVVAALLIRTRRGSAAADGSPARAWKLGDDQAVRISVLALCLVVTVVSGINVAEVFFVRGDLHATETMYGFVVGAWPIGMTIGAWMLSGWLRRASDPQVVRMLFVAMAVACLALGSSGMIFGSAWLLLPFWLVGGFANGAINVAMGVLVARRVAPEARGRAQAVIQGAVQGSSLAGYLGIGAVMELVDARWIVIFVGIGGLAMVLTALPLLRKIKAPAPVATGIVTA